MSKPTIEFCFDQINRLGGLDFAGTFDATAIEELADVLYDECASDVHVKHVISKYLREGGYFDESKKRHVHKIPSPYELTQFARSIPDPNAPPREPPVASDACEYCEGTGFEQVQLGSDRTAVKRCRCGGYPRPDAFAHSLEKRPERPVDPAAAEREASRLDALMKRKKLDDVPLSEADQAAVQAYFEKSRTGGGAAV